MCANSQPLHTNARNVTVIKKANNCQNFFGYAWDDSEKPSTPLLLPCSFSERLLPLSYANSVYAFENEDVLKAEKRVCKTMSITCLVRSSS